MKVRFVDYLLNVISKVSHSGVHVIMSKGFNYRNEGEGKRERERETLACSLWQQLTIVVQ